MVSSFNLGSESLRTQAFTLMVKLFVLFFLVPLHNIIKAHVASLFGDKTALKQGADSIDLRYHVEGRALFTFFLFGFLWSKPVRTSFKENSKHPLAATVATSLSGPLTYLLLGAIFAFAYTFVYPVESLMSIGGINYIFPLPAFYTGAGFFYEVTKILFVLFFVNLIPFRPFDLSEVLEYLLPRKYYISLNNFFVDYEAVIAIATILLVGVLAMVFISVPAEKLFFYLSNLFLRLIGK